MLLLFQNLSGQYTPHRHFTYKDGLPSDYVYMIIQDMEGYYWIATDKGLVKFDGYDFKTFGLEEGLPSEDVYEVRELNDGRKLLWHTNKTPSYIYNDSISNLDFRPPQNSRDNLIVELGEKVVLLTHDVNGSKSFFSLEKNGELIPFGVEEINKEIRKTLFEVDNFEDEIILFVGHRFRSEIVLQIRDFGLGLVSLNDAKVKPINKINNTYKVSSNNDCRIVNNKFRKTLQLFLKDSLLYTIDKEGNAKEESLPILDGLANRVFLDHNNDIWICRKTGLYFYDNWLIKNKVRYWPKYFSEIAYNQELDKVNLLNKKNELFLFDGNEITKFNQFSEKIVLRNLERVNNGFYFLTDDASLNIIDVDNQHIKTNWSQFRDVLKDGNDSRKMHSEFLSKTGTESFDDGIFVITKTGLYHIDLKLKTFSFIKQGEFSWITNGLNNNQIITGTDSMVYFFENHSPYSLQEELAIADVSLLLSISSNTYFVHCRKHKKSYILKEGMLKEVQQVRGKKIIQAKINSDYLYLLEEQQLSRVSIPSCGEMEDELDLLPHKVFGEFTIFSDLEIVKNDILIVSNNGLYVINKDIEREADGQLHLEFSVNGSVVKLNNEDKQIFKCDENTFVFGFKTIEGNSKDIVYQYQLKGVDTAFIETKQRSIRYPDLSYGSFHFEVFSTAANGCISEKSVYKFKISPPWYHTWIARFLYLAIIGLLTYSLIKLRDRRIKSKLVEQNILEKRFAELELNALQSQMNPHFVFNSLNGLQDLVNSNQNEQADLYIAKYSQLLRKFLNASKAKFISVKEEMEIIHLYVELEKLRFKDRFEYEIVNNLEQDNEEELIPSSIIQPFVENAINHGLFHKKGVGLLKINFSNDADAIYIQINDNGIGRQAAVEMKKKNQFGHKSFAIDSINEKINSLKKMNAIDISYSIEDKMDKQGHSTGTEVLIILNKDL